MQEVVFIADNELDRVFDAVNHDIESKSELVIQGVTHAASETSLKL